MLRFFADSVQHLDEVPDAAVFSGLADDLGDLGAITLAVRRALDVDALSTHLGATRKRGRVR